MSYTLNLHNVISQVHLNFLKYLIYSSNSDVVHYLKQLNLHTKQTEQKEITSKF